MAERVIKQIVHPQSGTSYQFPASPMLGQQDGTYLGRLIVEAWQPDANSDGLVYMISSPGGASVADQFAFDVVERLYARMQRVRQLQGG